MENILPALTVGLLYVLIGPSPAIASRLFKVAAFARIAHTIVYAFMPMPQPARALVFAIHYLISIYMGMSVLTYLW